jgi:hypothetical protein
VARRRTRVEGVAGDDLPAALLDPGARVARRAWFHARHLYAWSDQWDALQRSRAAHGLMPDGRRPDDPDPRDLLHGLTNDGPPTPRRRRA